MSTEVVENAEVETAPEGQAPVNPPSRPNKLPKPKAEVAYYAKHYSKKCTVEGRDGEFYVVMSGKKNTRIYSVESKEAYDTHLAEVETAQAAGCEPPSFTPNNETFLVANETILSVVSTKPEKEETTSEAATPEAATPEVATPEAATPEVNATAPAP